MKVLGIIPARYESTRFPGKPLADICGKPMIQHVYEIAKNALEEVVVATDDEVIYQVVEKFGGKAVMTNKNHNTGTNRCLEAYQKLGYDADVIINIQGDEPLLNPEDLIRLKNCFTDQTTVLATLAYQATSQDELQHGEGVYLVMNNKKEALYFSRSIIPFVRDSTPEEWVNKHHFYKHIGLYAYTPKALEKFAQLEQTTLEQKESLEQLRWLENGGKISVAIVDKPTQAVDTPEDLEKVIAILQNN